MKRATIMNGLLAAALAAAVALPHAAWAQGNYGNLSGTATQSLEGTQTADASNNYLAVQVRQPGLAVVINPGNATTPPSQVGYTNYRGGRAWIKTTGGDPFTDKDNDTRIAGPTVYSTWFAVQVGQTVPIGTATAPPDPRWYEVEGCYAPVNAPNQDFFTSYPTVSNGEVKFTWQIRQDHPGIANPIGNNATLANGGLAGNASPVLAVVSQSYRLVNDKVRCELFIQNVTSQSLRIASQCYINPTFGGGVRNGDRFHFQGVNQTIDHEISFPSTNAADDPALRRIPNFYRTFDNEQSPAVILGGLFDGADIRTAALTAGIPSQAMLVDQNLVTGGFFNYTPTGGSLVGANFAILQRWNQVLLAPTQGRRFITYFGLGGADASYDSSYVLSSEAPFSLALQQGDDPATPALEGADNLYRTPNPLTIRASVFNASDRPLGNVAVSLALPSGMTLATAGDTLSKSISVVPARTEQVLQWSVKTSGSIQPGVLTYTVSSSGTGLVSKVVSRDIGVPALPQLQFPNVARRLDMISVPYDFANRDIQHIFNSLGTIGVTGGGSAAIARYNPVGRAYAYFPDPYITNVAPGDGIWLFNGTLADLTLPTDRSQTLLTTPVSSPLNQGWNQIGCPYTVPVRLFDCQVISSDGIVRDFATAVNASLVRPVIYEYQPNDANPTQSGAYLFSGDDGTKINPWRGYWLRALSPVTLVFNANSLVGPFRSTGRSYLALRNGWECSVTASSSEFGDRVVQVGEDATSADGFDSRDVEMPPPVRATGDLHLGVLHDDWGRDAGRYMRDIQSVKRTARWRLVSECDRPNTEVTLRWNLRGVPADVQLTLVNPETGEQRHMRTMSGLTYNTGAIPKPKVFEVVASRNGNAPIAVPYLQAQPTKGRAMGVNFTLTGAATVDVVIESPTGRRVRLVTQGLAGVAGQNQVSWDGRDEEGRPVPAGLYRCRVLVSTADGQIAIAERTVNLTGR